MRHTAMLSLLPLLLVVGAGCGQDAAPKTDTKTSTKAEAEAEVKAEVKAEPKVEAPPVSEPAAENYGEEFCKTIIPCLQTLDFSGAFVADVTIDIEPDGSVSAASFTGEVPLPAQDCIIGAIERVKLDPYNGKPGRTQCTKSGQMKGGVQMITSDRTYEIREGGSVPAKDAKAENAPAEDAPAEGAKAKDAKAKDAKAEDAKAG